MGFIRFMGFMTFWKFLTFIIFFVRRINVIIFFSRLIPWVFPEKHTREPVICFLDPRASDGLLWTRVCSSVNPSMTHFSQNWLNSYFFIICMKVVVHKPSNVTARDKLLKVSCRFWSKVAEIWTFLIIAQNCFISWYFAWS